ncbi:hypothetical protein [Actinopolymorpha singaporensis]|uniref:Uncharacterized protein n=1 Tax=Actinopolymorpha singaporensis TaxID=117157 RepID=A0A1H1TBC0_9ACTN|nr:hypothetical protein [Actinopolymorpha singaporensis]SDS57448.1 hypothetical protein SAMN04489717_3129 [Actinopolymorpha singaporensis]
MSTGDNGVGREQTYAQRFKARLIQRGYDRDTDQGNAYTLGVLHYILTSAKAAPTAELMRAEVDKGLDVLAALDELTDDTDPTTNTTKTKRGGGRP